MLSKVMEEICLAIRNCCPVVVTHLTKMIIEGVNAYMGTQGLFTWRGGPPVQWGWFLLFSRSEGHKTKETYPTRPGSPTPCKQGLRLHVTFDVVSNSSKVNTRVRTLFLNKKFKDFQGHISHFSRTPSSAKSALSLALPQHEQFYPEGLSCQVHSLGWIKLAPKFKDFPVSTAIFKDFQGP